MSEQQTDVAVVGAGPYGLSTVAHLRAAGVETRVFGEPMVFWQEQMPVGMFLRSAWEASHIADPHRRYTLEAYQAATGARFAAPVPLDDFVRYGQWFQQQVAPDLDRRRVARVAREGAGFCLETEDGDTLRARRVVLATGIANVAHKPAELRMLPPDKTSHSSEERDLRRFAGQRVAVIGGGQSALESAALLHEGGADVEVLVRAPRIHFLKGAGLRSRLRDRLGPARPLLYPDTDVGPPGLSFLVAHPALFRQFPRELQDRIARRSIRPAGAAWLRPRLQDVSITLGRAVVGAAPDGERVRLTLDDATERRVHHVLLATGYRVNLDRYSYLDPALLRAIERVDGYPALRAGFETSVPGLHMVGAPAAISFGPLFRFVSGTGYAARPLTRRVLAGARAA
ncbi:MAG TPA: FAD-dependent oxidoreductase [Chloroflexota bacterium]|nr:FAD-dependent oxidoreductase [Chloroflexota bacterium]